MRMHLTILVAAALALPSCGDGKKAPAPGAVATTLGRFTAESATGTFRAALATENGKPIPLNEPFAITLELTGPDGSPWTEADQVTLDARMPAHRHGMLRDVELEKVGPGRFRAEGLLFHMIGHWEFHVDAVQGAHIERATSDVWLEL